MLKYVEDLVAERDHLTEMAQRLGDLAHEEERQLTDPEKAQLADWQAHCETLDGEIEAHSKVLDSTRKWADLKDRLEHSSNDRRLPARRPASPAPTEVRSVGQMFIESDQFQGYNGAGTTANVKLPAVLDNRAWSMRAAADPITTGDLTAAGMTGLIPPYLFEPPRPAWRTPLLDLVNVEPISTGSIEYFYFQPALPPVAAMVPEGTPKPPLDVQLELKAAPLETWAHWKAVTRQALEDFPRIRTIIEEYLRGGVVRKMESAISVALLADTLIATVADASLLAAIRLAQSQVETQGFMPNAVLLNPSDWAQIDIRLLVTTLGGPISAPSFWGLTPVPSATVPAGTAFVGDFRDGITFFDRRVTDVRLTDAHLGYFIENKIVILAEARGLAVVTQPAALVKATGAASQLILNIQPGPMGYSEAQVSAQQAGRQQRPPTS